jgi:tubulin--tyrosine ligase
VKDNSGPTLNKQRTTIIQLYIMPLLYQRRKFDFRCFLLVLQVGSRMRGYWYEEGYGRTASKEFSLINFRDRYVHLTNDAIQKKSEDYGKYEVGNKLSFMEIEAYLKSNYGRTNFY